MRLPEPSAKIHGGTSVALSLDMSKASPRLARLLVRLVAAAVPSAVALQACGGNVACPSPAGEQDFDLSSPPYYPGSDGLAGGDAGLVVDAGATADCTSLCNEYFSGYCIRPSSIDSCSIGPGEGGTTSPGTLHCVYSMEPDAAGYCLQPLALCPIGGRRPEGFVASLASRSARDPRSRAAGALLAELARLEAASVPAFRRLARELRAHGAPKRLVSRALCAARDEVRHARIMTELARAYGVEPSISPVAVGPVRTLEDVARENEAEGCVRETYGAIVALWQARTARDPAMRRAMTVIAADETRHAELAWQVASWARSLLDARARRRVASARRAAQSELRAQVAAPVDASLSRDLGLPDATQAAALERALNELLARV